MKSVSIVIPTLNAGRWIEPLLAKLAEQKPLPPDEIILVDSGSVDHTLPVAARMPGVKVVPVESFTHGGARNLGIRAAQGEIVVLMTQDAIPSDENWLHALIAPLEDPQVAGVYSRQVPRPDASPMERFFLLDRFPGGAREVRTHSGVEPPVYPETFFSNVSSAARRDVWMRFPFDEHLLMSEDQQFAAAVLMAGMKIAYEPQSVVVHSHRYSPFQTFQRYFDSVAAFRQLSTSHSVGASASLGGKTFWKELGFVSRNFPGWIPVYVVHLAAKILGVIAGHGAEKIPVAWAARFSMQPRWWMSRALTIRK